ncbi:MAG: ImmA/IrrE family metallo-endopeptidase [Chloroflexota bacterium]
MGLRPTDPLDAQAVAAHLRIGFRRADQLIPLEALEALERLQPGCFSACTLPGPVGPVVVINPLNSPGRQQSDAFHEISHIVLRHPMRHLERLGDLVFFTCDPDEEEQANALASTLLLPRPALVAAPAVVPALACRSPRCTGSASSSPGGA